MIAVRELVAMTERLELYARAQLAKAALPVGIALRDSRVDEVAADVAAYFDAAGKRATGTVGKALAFDWTPDRIDWTVEETELLGVLVRWYVTLGDDAFAAVSEQLAVEIRFDLGSKASKAVLEELGLQVKGISAQSRAILQRLVGHALERGYSIEQLVAGVKDDGFAGIRGLFADWSSTRARTVALTETANAYNRASLDGYAETGLVDTVQVFDGPDCGWTSHDDPDLANGSTRTLEEARRHAIAHPRCQRAFGAVVIR